MRAVLAVVLLLLIILPGIARSERPGISPSVTTERNDANWADLDAAARMTDGDNEGATQAERYAERERARAQQDEQIARPQRQD